MSGSISIVDLSGAGTYLTFDFDEVSTGTPNRDMVARDLRVSAKVLSNVPRPPDHYISVYLQLAGGNTVLSCSSEFNGELSCTAAGPAAVPAGSTMALAVYTDAATGPIPAMRMNIGFLLTPA